MNRLSLAFATVTAAAMILVATPAAHAQFHHDPAFHLGADNFAGTVSTAVSRAIAEALEETAGQLIAELSAGTLVDPNGAAISGEAQALVLSVIQGLTTPDQVEAILLNSDAKDPSQDVATMLVQLLTSPQPGQVSLFINRFNALVLEASPDFLGSPPDVFRVAWAIATRLGQAATPPEGA